MDLNKLRKPDLVLMFQELGIKVATIHRKPLLIQVVKDSGADAEELAECWELIQERMKRAQEVKERERLMFERETVRRKEEAESQERELERLRLQLKIAEAKGASDLGTENAEIQAGARLAPVRRKNRQRLHRQSKAERGPQAPVSISASKSSMTQDTQADEKVVEGGVQKGDVPSAAGSKATADSPAKPGDLELAHPATSENPKATVFTSLPGSSEHPASSSSDTAAPRASANKGKKDDRYALGLAVQSPTGTGGGRGTFARQHESRRDVQELHDAKKVPSESRQQVLLFRLVCACAVDRGDAEMRLLGDLLCAVLCRGVLCCVACVCGWWLTVSETPERKHNGHFREQHHCSPSVTSSGAGRAVMTGTARRWLARDAHRRNGKTLSTSCRNAGGVCVRRRKRTSASLGHTACV
ncbi:hypothetical protein HPB51_024975 [Rhipicephalus microplus]|uniref:Uncharacterized protein n=1 Tax=Rhipicephalus microplus TaxID=6941 RepID=A0A9J6EV69_RHIMP|nr:hypothetical protein HPB51_024975 [Rhipicephalus microplus]